MSVINQMLNQLEQRGVHTVAEQAMVRAVPHIRRNFTKPLLACGLILIAGIAAWKLAPINKQNIAVASIAPKVTQEFSRSEGAGNSSSTDEPDKLASPQAVEIVTPASGVSVTNLPASRLSFELSSVSLPTTNSAQKNISGTPQVTEKPAKAPVKINPAPSTAKAVVPTPQDALPMKQVSTAQQADAEFRKAAALMQQGRIADALAGYEAALRLDASHDAARQALVALLLEGKRGTEAERVLQDRLNSKPDHTGFTMMLARLQVERGAVAEATATLEKALPYANSQADYQAFLAALLQRQNRNDEAIAHYQIALQLAPNNGIWLMGYGISLQAMQRNADAKVIFQRALDTQTLSPDLRAFVQLKLKGL
ncbi:MAG: tetratricopeptide repeat protein [Gallionella sp.]